jgi:hypothetical protein
MLNFENVLNSDDRKAGTLISCGAKGIILAFSGTRDGG